MTLIRDRLRIHRNKVEILLLLLILVLAGYLRLAHNVNNPSWYTDEGTHLSIAQNLAQGRVQYLAINQSTLLFAKLPLFEMLLAGLLKIWWGGMRTLRTLTGSLGVITVGFLYGVVRRIKGDPTLALSSALSFAIYPQAILTSRFGFSYNLLPPLILLTTLGLWLYLDAAHENSPSRCRGLGLAALAIGLGSLSDLWMFALIAPMLLVISVRQKRDVLWSLPLALLPFGIYTVIMLIRVPGAFIFDLGFTLSRLTRVPLQAQISKLALNYTVLISQDHWTALALVGIFLLRPVRLQRLILVMFLLPILILGRSEALYNLSFYYTIPLLPFIALGMASFLHHGLQWTMSGMRDALHSILQHWGGPHLPMRHATVDKVISISTILLISTLILSPFLTSAVWSMQQVKQGFSTIIDPFLITPDDAQAAATYVNRRTQPDALVIASPGLAWLLDADAADYQMVVAFSGQETPHLPPNIPPDRWAFAPVLTQADFVIVDKLWYTWAAVNVPGVSSLLQELKTWSVAFQSGDVTVYAK